MDQMTQRKEKSYDPPPPQNRSLAVPRFSAALPRFSAALPDLGGSTGQVLTVEELSGSNQSINNPAASNHDVFHDAE
jgi:hypothetical protein